MYSHNDLKRYSGGNPLFKDLPKEVKEILVNKFSDLLAEDLTTIARYDPLEVPNALQLIDFESGEPIEESGKDGKLAESTESPENKEDPDEVEVDKYLKDIDSNDLIQDLKELQKENPKAKTQKLFDQAELGSDSEDEGEDQDTELTRRLRPRTGKTVRFKLKKFGSTYLCEAPHDRNSKVMVPLSDLVPDRVLSLALPSLVPSQVRS